MEASAADSVELIFARRGWLCLQPADFRQALVRRGRIQTIAAGKPIFHSGDDGGGIYGIVSGAIGCEVTTAVTGPTLVHVMQRGWWFGEGPMLFGRARNMSFMAMEDTMVLLVPLSAIRALVADDPRAAGLLAQIAEISAVLAIEAGCELLIRDARQRVAAVLLRVTAVLEGVDPDDPRGFRITQSQLAEMSNVSRHHTNVALIALQAAGLVALDYGRIAVREPRRLAAFAGSGHWA